MTPVSPRWAPLVGGAGVTAGAGLAAATWTLRRWDRADQPTTERFGELPGAHEDVVTSRDGTMIAVSVAGPDHPGTKRTGGRVTSRHAGHTVVLAHGWTNDRRVWEPVACRVVAAGHRVVLYDQRGHGASNLGSDGFSLEALADDLRTVLEATDAEHAVVAGHSMGGMAAQLFATRHHDVARRRLGALVLVATACDQVGTGRTIADRWAPRVVAHRRVDQALSVRGLAPFLVRRAFGRRACRAHLDSLCEMFVATPGQVRAEALTALMSLDLSPLIGDLRVPVTVVAGSRDRLLPPSRARRIAELVPGATLITYEGTGHMIPLEAPERLAALLTEQARRARAATTTQRSAS